MVHYPGAKITNDLLTRRPTGIGLVYALKEEYFKNNIKLNTFLDSNDFKQILMEKLNIPKNIDGWGMFIK